MHFQSPIFSCVRLSILLGFLGMLHASAQTTAVGDDFANKSIEELMNIDVTSVSRKEQKLSKTPAAVYVLTHEAIERSGATTVPDLLRMVPGVQVAQVDANRWAVSVRGFNDVYSNKLLVLVDGRTVYTPSFSGVYWNQLDVPLDTIARIEVVRGPGGTVWGANAVNGVINIITEHSKNTQGARFSAGAGSFQTGGYEARFGGSLGQAGSYRAFGGFAGFGSLPIAPGQSGHDGWQIGHGGFRADLSRSAKDAFMFEGSAFRTDGGQTLNKSTLAAQPFDDHGFDILGRWTRTHSETSQSSLQIYSSSYSRLDSGIAEQVSALDFDFQNHTSFGGRNDVVWGLGYRLNRDVIQSEFDPLTSLQTIGFYPRISPQSKDYSLFSSFFQDEISLTDKLSVTLGTKIEHNAFTAFEFEPSLRLAWTPNAAHTVWLAASKAVRQPSRLDVSVGVQLPPAYAANGFAFTANILGNPHFQAETVRAYEAGYRTALSKNLSLDLSTFYNFYRNLKSASLTAPRFNFTPELLTVTLPIVFGNGMKAQSYGGEAGVTWNAAAHWKLVSGYALLRTSASSAVDASAASALLSSQLLSPSLAASLGQIGVLIAKSNDIGNGPAPQHQFSVQSYWDVNSKLYFDTSLYHVGRLNPINVPAYTRVDARLAYKLREGIELSIVGQNLASPRHLEFIDAQQAVQTQAERNVFGKVVWSF